MMIRRLMQMIVCLLIVTLTNDVSGQKKSQYFQIPGRVKMDKGDPNGAVVNVLNLESKQIEKSLTVSSLGKFDLQLNYQTEYKLTVSKDGYFSKDILISTLIPQNVWEKDSVFPPFFIVVTLFKKVTDAPLSFIGRTIGKVSYSPNGTLDNFDSQIYIEDKDIREEIDIATKSNGDNEFNQKLTSALEFEKNNDLKSAYLAYIDASRLKPSDKFVKEKLKELAADLKDLVNELKIQTEFNRLIALGDANVSNVKYPEAIVNFKGALALKPDDATAKDKLAGAEQLLAKVNADKARVEEEFKRLLASGDDNVTKQLYPQAIGNYKGALDIKPRDPSAIAKLAAVEKILAKLNADKTRLEAEFNRLLAAGDKNVADLKYQEGIANFKGALTLKPNDITAKDKLSAAEQLLAKVNSDKARTEEEFKRLLASGDVNVTKQLYPEAIGNYNGALKIKPNDPSAIAKLAAAEKLLARLNTDKAKIEEQFNRLLASGDDNVSKQLYPDAIDNYNGALKLKPNDPSAVAKLAAAEKLLAKINADKAKLEEEFKRLLALGDDNVTKQLYPEAIGNYNGALKIKPNDPSAVAKLAAAEKLLAKLNADKAKIEEHFNRLLASGDDNVSKQLYPQAIDNYNGALKLKPNDLSSVAKLAATEQLLAKTNADKAKLEEEFNKQLASGDDNVSKQLYPEAIGNYNGALKIKPNDPLAIAKLASAEKLLAKLNADKAKIEEQFNRLLASGDNNISKQLYSDAIENYNGALKLKPGETTALAKLAAAEKLLAKINSDKAKLEEEFNRLLASGDDNVSKQLYPEAIGNYSGALKIKPNDPSAIAKLAAAEKLLAKLNTDKAKIEEQFNRLLASGDANVSNQLYPDAIVSYNGALKLKPGDAAALAKLTSAEKLMAKINADKAKLEEEFNRLLASGDDNVSKQLYLEAVGNYNGALKLKPHDTTALAKLATAEKLLAKTNSDKAKLEEEFNRLLVSGDDNITKQLYPVAIDNYNGALKLKPGDATAATKLASAEKLLAKTNADKAKLEEEFNRLLASGDDNVTKQLYPEAIGNYNGALKIKFNDPSAIAKLAAAEKLLAKTNADKAKLEEEFNKQLASGDDNVSKQLYHEAIDNYNGALKLKPGDATAATKLASAEKLLAKTSADKVKLEEEFNRLLASGDDNVTKQLYPEAIGNYNGALKIKPNDPSTIAKLASAEKLLAKVNAEKAKLEEDFNRFLASGDDNVKSGKYSEALKDYKDALNIKIANELVTAKITDVQKRILQKEAENQAVAEKQRLYQETILRAANYVTTQQYKEAIAAYQEARKLKPEESLPQQKIQEIQFILDDIAAKELLAHKQAETKKSNENAYQENIRKGDENFQKSQWTVSRFYYVEALKVRPDDNYAIGKVDACDKMTAANITSEKMLEYKNRISKGDAESNSKNYSSARFYYRNALEILPWESYPQAKLKEIDQIYAEKLTQADQVLFKESLTKGDEALARKEYSIARFYYNKANELNQVEYVSAKLKEIEGIVSGSEAIKINAEYEDCIKKADEAIQQKNPSVARFYYQKAITLKPAESYSKNQLKILSVEN